MWLYSNITTLFFFPFSNFLFTFIRSATFWLILSWNLTDLRSNRNTVLTVYDVTWPHHKLQTQQDQTQHQVLVLCFTENGSWCLDSFCICSDSCISAAASTSFSCVPELRIHVRCQIKHGWSKTEAVKNKNWILCWLQVQQECSERCRLSVFKHV